jgi:hypothetical protein
MEGMAWWWWWASRVGLVGRMLKAVVAAVVWKLWANEGSVVVVEVVVRVRAGETRTDITCTAKNERTKKEDKDAQGAELGRESSGGPTPRGSRF